MCVFLDDDSGKQLTVEERKAIQASLDIENKDDCVLEGSDRRLETHPRAMGSPRMLGALPTCIEA